METEASIRCAVCADRIGVYEPIVVVDDEGARETSRALEPQVARAGALLMHAACAAKHRSA